MAFVLENCHRMIRPELEELEDVPVVAIIGAWSKWSSCTSTITLRGANMCFCTPHFLMMKHLCYFQIFYLIWVKCLKI